MAVLPNDCVARFIREEKDCRNGIINLRVFIPGCRATEISVFVISGLEKNEIWELGQNRLNTSIVGRANLIVSFIREQGFEIVKNKPNDRHAAIIPVPKLPFPDNPNDWRNATARNKRRDIAIKLRKISTLHIK